jgi:hypothetical protein
MGEEFLLSLQVTVRTVSVMFADLRNSPINHIGKCAELEEIDNFLYPWQKPRTEKNEKRSRFFFYIFFKNS